MRRRVRMTRQAMAPRLAMRTLVNTGAGLFNHETHERGGGRVGHEAEQETLTAGMHVAGGVAVADGVGLAGTGAAEGIVPAE